MAHAHLRPLQGRAKVTGAPITDEPPRSLLPALSELRKAKETFEIIRIFEDTIPDELWAKALSEMLRRPAMFPPEVIREALGLVGFQAVAKELGVTPAGVAFNRFLPTGVAAG